MSSLNVLNVSQETVFINNREQAHCHQKLEMVPSVVWGESKNDVGASWPLTPFVVPYDSESRRKFTQLPSRSYSSKVINAREDGVESAASLRRLASHRLRECEATESKEMTDPGVAGSCSSYPVCGGVALGNGYGW